jgi:SAM-dependent methyltransferase
MERQAWLAERRAAVVADYDAEAATYDLNLYPADAQEEWVARLLGLIPAGGTVLDAPCGTGRYFSLIAGAGMRVVGVDQSAGMLAHSAHRPRFRRIGSTRTASIARRDHRGRRGGISLLPGPRPGHGVVRGCWPRCHRRGLQRRRGLGLPPLPAPRTAIAGGPRGRRACLA